jgi:hypothetical protein
MTMRPPPAAHRGPRRLRQPQRRLRGQAQHLLHRLVLDRFQHLVLDPARVVDQEVDAAVHLQQLLHQRMATGAMVDGTACGLYRQALPLQRCDAAQDALRVSASAIGTGTDVMHHHLRTTLGQQAAVGQAQSTGGTGHQAHLAFKGNTGNRLHQHSFGQVTHARPIPLTTAHDTPALSPKKGTEGIKSFQAQLGRLRLNPLRPLF